MSLWFSVSSDLDPTLFSFLSPTQTLTVYFSFPKSFQQTCLNLITKKLIWWYYKREPGISTNFPQHTWVYCVCVSMRAKLLQSCPAFCNSMDCSPPGSSIHGILQASILEWVAIPSSFLPRDRTQISYIS